MDISIEVIVKNYFFSNFEWRAKQVNNNKNNYHIELNFTGLQIKRLGPKMIKQEIMKTGRWRNQYQLNRARKNQNIRQDQVTKFRTRQRGLQYPIVNSIPKNKKR